MQIAKTPTFFLVVFVQFAFHSFVPLEDQLIWRQQIG